MPVIPATQEAEAEESLEPQRQRLHWAEITPLHSSLGDRARPHLKRKKRMRAIQRKAELTVESSGAHGFNCPKTVQLYQLPFCLFSLNQYELVFHHTFVTKRVLPNNYHFTNTHTCMHTHFFLPPTPWYFRTHTLLKEKMHLIGRTAPRRKGRLYPSSAKCPPLAA